MAVHRLEYAIHHPENVPPRLTKYLKRKLDLTDPQAAQVQSIITQRQTSLGRIRLQVQAAGSAGSSTSSASKSPAC